jgi:hypothetical protein
MAIRNIIRQNRLVFFHILKILPVLNDWQ